MGSVFCLSLILDAIACMAYMKCITRGEGDTFGDICGIRDTDPFNRRKLIEFESMRDFDGTWCAHEDVTVLAFSWSTGLGLPYA